MDYLFVGALILILFYTLAKVTAQMSTGLQLKVPERRCPPHKWFWQQLVDEDGNKQGERMVCEHCGPISKLLEGSQE